MYTTLIESEDLHSHMDDPGWVIVDCRFSLADTAAGYRAYQQSHIPGAVYAHLDNDLSGPPITDVGRHPLPTPEVLMLLFSRMGIGEGTQVVVYDDANGAIASRLWWMLHYMGHSAAAVLDGGWGAWIEAGLSTREGVEENTLAEFNGAPRTDRLVLVDEVPAISFLVDSRAQARHRGDIEPIDPVAGHIPGSLNYYYRENWGQNGRYLPPDQMRAQLEKLLGETPPDEAVFYCGSGVTACVNLLALAHVGMGEGRLYVGSWSEWSSDPERPVATS